MLQTPFLGKQINVILPGSIILFSIVFIIMSFLHYEKKAVSVIKNLNSRLNKLYGSATGETNAPVLALKFGKIEKLYKGEIAYLKELKA